MKRMTALLIALMTLSACKGAATDDSATDDSNATDDSATDDSAVETGTLNGTVAWPDGTMPAGTTLYVAVSTEDRIWDNVVERKAIEPPSLPATYSLELEPGSYYVAAFLDLVGENPSRPGAGDAEGTLIANGSKVALEVTAGETTDAPVIKLRLNPGDDE